MATLYNGTKLMEDILISKQLGTVLTLHTDKTYVDKDIQLTINVQSAAEAADTASADADVVSTSGSAGGTNIGGSIGTKTTTEPSTGYYIRLTASGSGSSKVTSAGWLATGSLTTASTTSTLYFPIDAATVTQNAPTVNSTGLVTATSTITAGYVSAGTESNTLQLTTQGAQTITPTTSDQTISSGQYLTGTQTIKGDPNLIASNIKKNIEIFGVTGTLIESTVLVSQSLDVHGGTMVTLTTVGDRYDSAEAVSF